MTFRVTTSISGFSGGPYLSQMHFSEALGALAQDAADAVKVFWAAVDNLMANDLTWTVPGEVEQFDPANGNLTGIVAVTGGTGTGADATSYLPPANQMLIRWRTGTFVGGREIRGRTFIPGVTEAGTADGVLEASWQSTLLSAANALIADTDSELQIWSPTQGATADVASASVWNQLAVLRSRRD